MCKVFGELRRRVDVARCGWEIAAAGSRISWRRYSSDLFCTTSLNGTLLSIVMNRGSMECRAHDDFDPPDVMVAVQRNRRNSSLIEGVSPASVGFDHSLAEEETSHADSRSQDISRLKPLPDQPGHPARVHVGNLVLLH